MTRNAAHRADRRAIALSLFAVLVAAIVLAAGAGPTKADEPNLRLTSMCSPDPDTSRVWRVRNARAETVIFTWVVVGTGQSGEETAPAAVGLEPGTVFFETATVPGPNTTKIMVGGVQHDVKASNPAACPTPTPTQTLIGLNWLQTTGGTGPARRGARVHAARGAGDSAVELRVVADPPVADPGDSVDVTVVITSAVALRGMQFSLRFDPAIVQATAFEEGPFLRDWATAHGGTTLVFPNPPPIDNVAGRAGVVGISIMGGEQGGASGAGVVGTFKLTVKPDPDGGPTGLSLEDVVVSDAQADELGDVAVTPGVLVITGELATATDTLPPTATATPPPTPTELTTATATPSPSPSSTSTQAPTVEPTATSTDPGMGDVTLSVMPSPSAVEAGGIVAVDVVITAGIEVRGLQMGLRFDPAVFEATAFEEGPFLRDWAAANGATTLIFPNPAPIDNANGKAGVVGISIMGGGEGGPTGSGTVGTFRLTVKAGAPAGASALVLEDVVVSDRNADEVPATVIGAAVRVAGGATEPPPPTTTATASLPTATEMPAPGTHTIYLPQAVRR